MKKIIRVFLTLLITINIFSCNQNQSPPPTTFTTTVSDIQKYGNLVLDIVGNDFLKSGFDFGDIINVNINNVDYEMPVGSSYSDVEQGEYICRVGIDTDANIDCVIIAINMGDFASSTKIATKTKTDESLGFKWTYNVPEPCRVNISMKEKGGYYEEYVSHSLALVRTNDRNDYPNLTDEEYANFRMIKTSNIKEGILYRTSSPINSNIGRNTYADKAMRNANVKTTINLADDKTTMESYENYTETYYSTTNIIPLNLALDFTTAEFKAGIARAFRFIGENEGPYLVHCLEGKDRAGYISSLLECIMGASADEVVSDYMVSYYNYYNVDQKDERYNKIKTNNIEKLLKNAFAVDNIYNVDLKKECEELLVSIGLSNDEIEVVRQKLQK